MSEQWAEGEVNRIYRRLGGTTSKDCIRAVLHVAEVVPVAEVEELRARTPTKPREATKHHFPTVIDRTGIHTATCKCPVCKPIPKTGKSKR